MEVSLYSNHGNGNVYGYGYNNGNGYGVEWYGWLWLWLWLWCGIVLYVCTVHYTVRKKVEVQYSIAQ